MWDILDIVDIFVEPVADFVLCRGKVGIWLKKRFISFLLLAGSVGVLLRLFSAIESGSVAGILVWGIGSILLSVLDISYTVWWIREGRHGADLPLIDKIPLPKADLTNIPYDEAPFRTQPEEDIWKQLGVRD